MSPLPAGRALCPLRLLTREMMTTRALGSSHCCSPEEDSEVVVLKTWYGEEVDSEV